MTICATLSVAVDEYILAAAVAEEVTIESALAYIKEEVADPFEGDYEYTPSEETQTIQISGKTAEQNIIINPIPNNYGLITWNGSTLTVS